MIELTWVEWDWPDRGVGRYNAHVKLPHKDETACGITTTLGKGAQEVGRHTPTERPWRHTCCRECLQRRAAVADQMRLKMWQEAQP